MHVFRKSRSVLDPRPLWVSHGGHRVSGPRTEKETASWEEGCLSRIKKRQATHVQTIALFFAFRARLLSTALYDEHNLQKIARET